ncbi:zinc finger, CCHC-type containing protein [Tanacetum coccineum]
MDGSSNSLKGHNMFNKSLQVYYVTYVSEAYFVQDDDIAWWVDSGATIHVCKDSCWFKTYESLNDGSILHMGNKSTALVHGRGYVDLRFCYVYLLHTKDEALDKFKVFKTEVELQQGSLIKRFRTDRGGLSQGFWGEAMLTACYLLNRVPNKRNMITPYELWTKRKPNLNYLRVWGCRAVVRLPDPKLKTLGERGIECIFVGYAEHSKAFRFFVIEPNEPVSINTIIESRDAIFNENRLSSVPRPSLSIPKGTEDIGGSVVPEKVTKEDVTFWKEAINDGMDSIMGNNTWVLADLPLVEHISTIKLLLAMASIHNLIIYQMDVKIAFLNVELDEEVDIIKEFLSSRFSMKDMRKADVIPVSTPMDTSEKLMPNNGHVVSQLEYYRVIGCLMYAMTCTRPDIAFVVGKLSRYTSNSGTQHWQAIQRVLKYLKKTMDYRLTYIVYPSVLEGYTDLSWISNIEDNSSTSGWVFLLGGGAISWASKKQTSITGSTMKYEFVALAAADKEAEWLRNLILEILLWSKPIAPISIRCDSTATLAKFVRSQQNLVDRLTKELARDLVIKSVEGMGLKSN